MLEHLFGELGELEGGVEAVGLRWGEEVQAEGGEVDVAAVAETVRSMLVSGAIEEIGSELTSQH